MKLKDIPKNQSLVGLKLKKQNLYIYSGWNRGFWCKKKMSDEQIIPVFFNDWKEIENWEIEQ